MVVGVSSPIGRAEYKVPLAPSRAPLDSEATICPPKGRTGKLPLFPLMRINFFRPAQKSFISGITERIQSECNNFNLIIKLLLLLDLN